MRLIGAAVIFGLLFASFDLSKPDSAQACSLVNPDQLRSFAEYYLGGNQPTPAGNLSSDTYVIDRITTSALSEAKEEPLIVIASVLDEKASGDSVSLFDSTIEIHAVLYGASKYEGDRIHFVGLNDNCPGPGARLREGERVLLFVDKRSWAPGGVWTLSALGGKVLIRDGNGYIEDVGYEPELVGDIDALIHHVALISGADADRTQDAIRAAKAGTGQVGPDFGTREGLPGIVLTLLVVVVPVGFFLTQRLRGQAGS